MGFKLSLNTSTIKPVGLLEKVRLVAEAGFAGIELWINDVYEHVGRGGEVREVTKAIADHGLVVPNCIAIRGWGEAIDVEYPLHLDEARRRMEMAARLGSLYIVATPPRMAGDFGQITKRYVDLLRIGREVGVKPIMEYISFFGSVYSLEQAWQIVRECGEEDATLIPDAFHTWNSGSDPELLTKIPRKYIAHYHVDDAPSTKAARTQTDPDRVMPGEGVIDLRAEARRLKQIGYDGWVSLELFNRELWAKDPREVLKRGYERMVEFFG